MAKPSVKVEINNFVRGFITEASPLNFPENATIDEENYQLNRDGTRDRRFGMEQDPNSTSLVIPSSSTIINGSSINRFKWTSVGGDPNLNILVIEIGKTLYFFRMNVEPLISGYLGFIILSYTDFTSSEVSFCSVSGKLVVVHGSDKIGIVGYNPPPFNNVYIEYGSISTRDVWGIEVTTIPKYETDSSFRNGYSSQHSYNLQNQSWGIPRKNKLNNSVDPQEQYNTDLGVYPSNSETVWAGLQFQPVAGGADPYERMFTNLYEDALGADVKAAKGYFIINALRRGDGRQQAYSDNKIKYPELLSQSVAFPADITPGGPTVACEFAGRVFYAGFQGSVHEGDSRSPNLVNYIFFSQLVDSSSDILKCYQDGDPTSRDNSDIVDTDGGFFRLSGAEKIISMINLSTHLIVICNNGVWTVTGGNNYGFSATNYKVDKISAFGGLSSTSVTVVGDVSFFWGDQGIYTIQKNQYGDYVVSSVTEQTIQTFYDAIPVTSKSKAYGVYDSSGKTVRWLYRTGQMFMPESRIYELILDTTLGSFYKYRIFNPNSGTSRIEVSCVFESDSFLTVPTSETVMVGDDVVFAGSDEVVVSLESRTAGNQTTKYLILNENADTKQVNLSFGYYHNTNFVDFPQIDGGIDAHAYMLTGAIIAGDSSVHKQVPYIVTHFKRTESGVINNLPDNPSGCLIRSQWDWANSVVSNKWSPLMQAYRYKLPRFISGPNDDYDNGFELVTTKNKLRGRGRAFSLYMETEPEKDCRIVGWSLSINGNQVT